MTEPLGEPLSANLIERYLRTRAPRYFRGRHDGEFFFVLADRGRRLHVHLEIPPMHHDVVTIRVDRVSFFPATEHSRLMHFADEWNEQNRDVTAIVHGSSDPGRIGVTAEQSRWIGQAARFDEFATFADRATAAAIDLFSRLDSAAGLPSPPVLRAVG